MSRWENKFSRKSQATSRPSPSSVISHPSWKRAVPVERMLRRAERFGSEISGMGWFCKAKRTSNSGLYPGFRLLAERAHQLDERHGVGKRVHRQLMHRSQMISRQRASDRSARAEGRCPRSIPSFPAPFVWRDWRPAFRRQDRRIRSIRRTRFGKPRAAR